MAMECMRVAREVGLNVPSDLSIIGFDSLDFCNRTNPPLTSVRQPIFEMASLATTLLVQVLNGEKPERPQILFPPVLDVRASTGPIAH
jgi:LacI family transcriptional regulator